MTLAALLSELSIALPERVRVIYNDTDPADVWATHVEVKYHGWREVWTGGDMPCWGQAWALEGMLREECEARGCSWALGQEAGGRPYAAVMPTPAHRPPHYASTPAEALGIAMLAALKSEKGEG